MSPDRAADPIDLTDYYVDLCFLTYVEGGLGSEDAAGTGIRPGMVGRKQRRFIIYLEVPPALADRGAYCDWITSALSEATVIVRNYLPNTGRRYPADRLACELEDLRCRWIDHLASTN